MAFIKIKFYALLETGIEAQPPVLRDFLETNWGSGVVAVRTRRTRLSPGRSAFAARSMPYFQAAITRTDCVAEHYFHAHVPSFFFSSISSLCGKLLVASHADNAYKQILIIEHLGC